MKSWLLVALAASALVWLAHPFSTGLLRYAAWRAVAGRSFVTGSVMSRDARIGFRTIGPLGPGPPAPVALVLLHGGFGSDLDWYAQIPALARRHALVLVDSRGHGESTQGNQALSYALLARDLLAVLDVLGLGRVDIAGWSDGGNTGLVFAGQHPDRVRRLIAISANARPDGLAPDIRDALVRDETTGSLPARLLHRLLSPEPERWHQLVERVTNMWRDHPVTVELDLDAIEAATLLIAGAEDDVRRDHLDEIVRAVPNARLVVLPNVGHRVPQSAPRHVLNLMEEFLMHTSRARSKAMR